MIKRQWDRRAARKTWYDFLEEFNAKYIPECIKDKREAKFMELEQKGLIVS